MFFRPLGMIVRGGLMFYNSSFFFCSARDLRGPWADRPEILPHGRKHVQFTNASPKISGLAPQKILGVKNMLNLAPFWTPFHFEREYLRNG